MTSSLMNSVNYIFANKPLRFEEKVRAKSLGRATPDLIFNVPFNRELTYDKYNWMCGCPDRNKLYCFICIIGVEHKNEGKSQEVTSQEDTIWTVQGYSNMNDLHDSPLKHERSAQHMHNLLYYSHKLNNSEDQLTPDYLSKIRIHNDIVTRNREIVRRLISSIKQRVSGMTDSPQTLGNSFRNFMFSDHLESILEQFSVTDDMQSFFYGMTIYKFMNKVLESMLLVCKQEIKRQIKKSNFVTVLADEVVDTQNRTFLVVSFRFVHEGDVVHKFWKIDMPESFTAASIAHIIDRELCDAEVSDRQLIGQCYRVSFGDQVQLKIRNKYPRAIPFHSYTHFTQILERSSERNKKMEWFFSRINLFTSFFTNLVELPNLAEIFDETSANKLQEWDFSTQTIHIVYEHKNTSLRTILTAILETSKDKNMFSAADCLMMCLNSADFLYFLAVTQAITSLVASFFQQVLPKKPDRAHVDECLSRLESGIAALQEKLIQTSESEIVEANAVSAKDYCKAVVSSIHNMFNFIGHLVASQLFEPANWQTYQRSFPTSTLLQTVDCYDALDKKKLILEMKVFYERRSSCHGVQSLLKFLYASGMHVSFSEIYKLLDILCTIPRETEDINSCCSKLKSIKLFLGNNTFLWMLEIICTLSTEEDVVYSMPEYDEEVIDLLSDEKRIKLKFR